MEQIAILREQVAVYGAHVHHCCGSQAALGCSSLAPLSQCNRAFLIVKMKCEGLPVQATLYSERAGRTQGSRNLMLFT